MRINNIVTSRTARYFTLGEINDSVKEVWFVLHGYGQLASEFIKFFEVLDDGTKLIIAPEGLSRFYLKNGAGQVGASWMTNEDRLNEIEDYVNYLSQVHSEILPTGNRSIKKRLLGYSQGTATATRWFEKSKIQFDNLIIWGGHLASEANLGNSKYLETRVSMVYGAEDRFMFPTYFEEDISILKKYNVGYSLFSYNGGHTIDIDTLIKLAKNL